MTKATKGDLLIVRRSGSATTLGGGTEHYQTIEPMLAEKATKAGIVTVARSKMGTVSKIPSSFAAEVFVVSAKYLNGKAPADVFASLPETFNTLDDARLIVRQAVSPVAESVR